MSLAQKTLHASVFAYLSALFGCLTFALLKIDFTGYPVGKVGLIILMITTGFVAYRLITPMLRNLRPKNGWAWFNFSSLARLLFVKTKCLSDYIVTESSRRLMYGDAWWTWTTKQQTDKKICLAPCRALTPFWRAAANSLGCFPWTSRYKNAWNCHNWYQARKSTTCKPSRRSEGDCAFWGFGVERKGWALIQDALISLTTCCAR